MDFAFEGGAGGVLLVERSNNIYKMLKKEARKHKKQIKYLHVDTAQYEKMGGLFNVFAEEERK